MGMPNKLKGLLKVRDLLREVEHSELRVVCGEFGKVRILGGEPNKKRLFFYVKRKIGFEQYGRILKLTKVERGRCECE